MRKTTILFFLSFFYFSGGKADVAIDPVQMYIFNDKKQKTTTLGRVKLEVRHKPPN
ncbi:hypothetical protein [Acinetobacter lwoffii]|uniref:hypothetical protein n=1 Tax=Acinetobacter lwoffii TaxID=28090 RepID=UPI00208DF6F8|nr:hypothetical protein [Acinetobacter lwoffii]